MSGIELHSGGGESRVRSLLRLLDVEQRAPALFEGARKQGGVGRIYGGEVVAQALAAACKTVPADRAVHSLHAYFLRGGDERCTSLYQVEADFDGRSFSNRRVIASQNDEVILNLAASFQVSEPGHHHQSTMPDVEGPEGVADHQEVFERLKKSEREPDAVRFALRRPWPMEMRPVRPKNATGDAGSAGSITYWFRLAAPIDAPQWMHRCILAFVSDMGVLTSSGLSHKIEDLQAASIDHSIWFHADIDTCEWMLFHITSPWSGNARGLGIGHIYARDGRLLATVAQEGLIRDRALNR